ncbi:hypothetical protein N9H39_00805 [Gammaproteobacteria bacterium]|nr:hypothetical protein [Gammaproteobacteria bacterium]
MLSELASDRVIDPTYDWLCRQRRDWPDRADVWDLRIHWDREKPRLKEALRTGRYRFSPLERVTNRNGENVSVWSARDALVIKALALVLGQTLPVSTRCTHVKGHGGQKGAVRAVRDALPQAQFVFRADVKSFYECIDQYRLLEQLSAHVKDRRVLNLVWQVMRRTVTWGGIYWDCDQGISRGCPLSPLLRAFSLSF